MTDLFRVAFRGVQLVKSLDLEARVMQQLDPLAVGLMEVDPVVVRPVDRSQSSLRPDEGLPDGFLAERVAEPGQRRVGEKNEPSPGRSSRCACGIHTNGSHQIAAPYSEKTMSNEPSSRGGASALA